MKNLAGMGALLALASMGAVIRVEDDVFDPKGVEPGHEERMQRRAAEVERQRQIQEARRAPKELSAKDAERVRLAAERRAAKIARQAGGFVTAKADASDAELGPGSAS